MNRGGEPRWPRRCTIPSTPQPIPTGTVATRRPDPGLFWMLRVVGFLALVHRGQPLPAVFLIRRRSVEQARAAGLGPLVAAVATSARSSRPAESDRPAFTWSTATAKPDARWRLGARGQGRRRAPAVRHLAAATSPGRCRQRHRRPPSGLPQRTAPTGTAPSRSSTPRRSLPNSTRVLETYDFTQIALLLDPDSPELPAHLAKRLAGGDRELGGAARASCAPASRRAAPSTGSWCASCCGSRT